MDSTTPVIGRVMGNTAAGDRTEILGATDHQTRRQALWLVRGLSLWRSHVQKLTLAVALAALVTLGACKKTGEGQYEVQKPVIGTETDTVNTPSIETGTVKDTVTVPTVGTEKKEVTLPKVEVNEPKE
jgi:hypothetical protein